MRRANVPLPDAAGPSIAMTTELMRKAFLVRLRAAGRPAESLGTMLHSQLRRQLPAPTHAVLAG
jgi:hypothetical protein